MCINEGLSILSKIAFLFEVNFLFIYQRTFVLKYISLNYALRVAQRLLPNWQFEFS